MIVMPAIDLREGHCVQLVGGSYDDERVRLPNPVAVAKQWEAMGFTHLHVVDLDAATGAGANGDVVPELIEATRMCTQIGGGVATDSNIRYLLRCGASRVVVGTRAIEQMDWLRVMAGRFPGRIVVAADVRGRSVVTRGWKVDSARSVHEVVAELVLNGTPLGGVLVTAVHVEGQQAGPDVALAREIVEVTAGKCPVFVAGGIGSLDDLRALADTGVTGVIVGMAFYTGALDPRAVAAEFASSIPVEPIPAERA